MAVTRAASPGVEVPTLGVDPGLGGHKVGHKRGHRALEDGVVPQHDGLKEDMNLVVLSSYCNKNKNGRGDECVNSLVDTRGITLSLILKAAKTVSRC